MLHTPKKSKDIYIFNGRTHYLNTFEAIIILTYKNLTEEDIPHSLD